MGVDQYLEIFISETKEHLQNLNDQLLILEKEPENEDTINEIFRAAHSLKGMAGTMGYKKMQELTHNMENVFSEIRAGNQKVEDSLVDILFEGLDALEVYLSEIEQTGKEGEKEYKEIIASLNGMLNLEKTDTPEKKKTYSVKKISFDSYLMDAMQVAEKIGRNTLEITIYLSSTCVLKAARVLLVFQELDRLGDIISAEPCVQELEEEQFEDHFSVLLTTKEVEEVVQEKLQGISEIDHVIVEKAHPDALKKKQQNSKRESSTQTKTSKPLVGRSVRIDIEKLDVLMNLVSELIIAKNGLVSFNHIEQADGFQEQIEYLERITTNLHESIMKVRMVPIENVVSRFPRMIRDLSKKLNKKMELIMEGEETELDRTVIDELGDPLMHLLRNSADHGIESTKERIRLGKPEVGRIYLKAYQDGNYVVIEIADDGAGVDIESVREKAIQKEIVSLEQIQTMTDEEVIQLLFLPSFSTSEKVTEISGRGVGLDVVKSKIESLGGSVHAKSKLREGSCFTIRLPLTLAIIQALMVGLGTEKYAIPLANIQTIEAVERKDVKHLQTKEVIHLRGSVIPLIHLGQLLDVEESNQETKEEDPLTVVIVAKGEALVGLVVDRLIGQQEIVIKSLEKYITHNQMLLGATILGDGEIALILDVNAFL